VGEGMGVRGGKVKGYGGLDLDICPGAPDRFLVTVTPLSRNLKFCYHRSVQFTKVVLSQKFRAKMKMSARAISNLRLIT